MITNSPIKQSPMQLMTLALAGISFQICAGLALVSALFVLDAPPDDRWAMWGILLLIVGYFASCTVLQVIGLRWHKAYRVAFLLSILTLTIALILRNELGFLGETLAASFYAIVAILGCLSFYLSWMGRTVSRP